MITHCKIIAIAKNEAAYIPQWIAHHLYFGFNELEIWVNGTTDNTIEMLTQISEKYPNVKFKNADELLNQCLASGENFQVTAYKEMLSSAKLEGKTTHLICLDLDELWTPKDFDTQIANAISNNDADAISFQWHLDTPSSNRAKFSRPFESNNTYQKNRHVKTLAKLSSKSLSINIHNYVIIDGIYTYCDGTAFEETDADQHSRSKVSNAYFEHTRTQIDDFYVLHQIYRSCEEYIASLSRGRSHAGDERAIKVNRDGYILEPFSQHGLAHHIACDKLKNYNRFYEKFISVTKVKEMLTSAERFNEAKYAEIVSRIRQSKDFYQEFSGQFKGVKLNDKLMDKIPHENIIFHIDSIAHTEDGSQIGIVGWAFDSLSDLAPLIRSELDAVILAATKVERPDVQKIHKDAPLDCGFRLTITAKDPTSNSLFKKNPKLYFKSADFTN